MCVYCFIQFDILSTKNIFGAYYVQISVPISNKKREWDTVPDFQELTV